MDTFNVHSMDMWAESTGLVIHLIWVGMVFDMEGKWGVKDGTGWLAGWMVGEDGGGTD